MTYLPEGFPQDSSIRDRRLLLTIFYEGPWERLQDLLWSVTRENEIRRVVPEGSLRDRLALYCEYRDRVWVYKYAVRNRAPNQFWRRRVPHHCEGEHHDEAQAPADGGADEAAGPG